MKHFLISLFSLSVLSGTIAAQEDIPPKHLRFIPLGERPTWREELIDGIRVGLEAPEGSMPPSELSVSSGKELLNSVPFQPNLRSMSKMLTIQGDTPKLLLKEGKIGVAQNWLATKIPAAPLSLGILYRDPASMNWANPKMLLLKDDKSSFPSGKIRFANTSDRMVIIQIGDWRASKPPQIFGIRPGTVSIKDLKVGNNQMRVGYTEAGGAKNWIWSNQIRILGNQRVQAFFYKAQNANGKPPSQKVLFHYLPEPAPRF